MHEKTRQARAKALRAYRRLMKYLDSLSNEEHRQMPAVEKLRHCFELMRLARVLGLHTSDEAKDAQVRERWRKLREAHNRQQNDSAESSQKIT